VLFPKAAVWIGRAELEWASAQPPRFDPLPELYVAALAKDARVRRIEAGDEFLPGFRAHMAPGHTPGSLIFTLSGNDVPVIFTGDAAKNRAELMSGHADSSMDETAGRKSIALIWSLWREKPGTLLIPGHDLAMTLGADGKPTYMGRREAGIGAWLTENIEVTTDFDLTSAPHAHRFAAE
jgi:glyoxylase-like metal-dependent hydrolase (beta-lactamase superfamily II)